RRSKNIFIIFIQDCRSSWLLETFSWLQVPFLRLSRDSCGLNKCATMCGVILYTFVAFVLIFYSVPPSTRQRRAARVLIEIQLTFCRHTSLPPREQRIVSYRALGTAVGYNCLKRRVAG